MPFILPLPSAVSLTIPSTVAVFFQAGSLKFFEPAGLFREAGRKFGRYWDAQWYERPLP